MVEKIEEDEVKVETAGKKTSTNVESTTVEYSKQRMYGRRQIFTNEKQINKSNVISVLNKALFTHYQNRDEMEYLYNYLKGKQPVINRIKAVREEICNKVVINRANEIVTFKTANFIGEPIQYVSHGTDEGVPDKIEKLNSFMRSEGKHSKDMELAYWMFTCGLGYRLVLNDKSVEFMDDAEFDEAPFEVYTLDPRNSFIVRLNDVTKRVVMGVSFVTKDKLSGEVEYTVYTKNETFIIEGTMMDANKIVSTVKHNFGMVPIVEYPCNPLRMGAFEVVLDLLDAINLTQSNRLDGIEQFIQALMVFENADITREQFLELKDLGAIKLPSVDGRPSKVYYLNEQLDQSQTQVLMDDMYQTVKEIVGIPSQGNSNTSDSSNNGAIILKNGWQNAEARAKETEGMWRQAETQFLKIVLKICSEADTINLKISDIELKFFRRSYEDKLTKANAFVQTLNSGMTPLQAFKFSEVFIDPESAAIEFEDYKAKKEQEMQEKLKEQMRVRATDGNDARKDSSNQTQNPVNQNNLENTDKV